MHKKSVFTTGEIANLLHIHQTTVIDWVDKGLLESYKTPGGHRRIGRAELFKFLEDHNMPVPNVLLSSSSNAEIDEKHRHLHEGYQVGPHSQSRPMEAFPPLSKKSGVRNIGRRGRAGKVGKGKK